MPVITKITQQKKNGERYNIFLDDQYAYSVHESVLVKFGLTKGKVLDAWTIDDMVYADEVSRAFNRALHYLSFQMRSESEVKQKLQEAGYGNAVITEAIVKLKELNFLDDMAFSEALLRTKKNTSAQGPKAIQQALQKKGIDSETQQQVLATYKREEQLELATKLAKKAAAANSKIPPAQVKQKIQNALLRKGYSFDITQEAIAAIDFNIEEDEWVAIVETTGEKAWRRYASKYEGYDLIQRVKQSMYRKGIPFEQIERFIEKKVSVEDGE